MCFEKKNPFLFLNNLLGKQANDPDTFIIPILQFPSDFLLDKLTLKWGKIHRMLRQKWYLNHIKSPAKGGSLHNGA